MADIIIGLILGAFGLLVCLAGLRVFFVALPIIGFVAGFYAGAAAIAAITNGSFLGDLTAVIVGFVVGVVFGTLAYLFWYLGALLSAGSTGALIGSGAMKAIGVSSGWVIFLIAAAVAIVFFAIAFLLALPVYVVVINTAFVGAAAAVTGLLLIINKIDRVDLHYGLAWATVNESWFWLIIWIVAAVVGILYQLQSIKAVVLPEDRWTRAEPA
ncbi:MAG TPA: DUF4203 domain-containing protein [Thermomicrobiales bacterium]|nr:DUF4203 domain-containing protein [Thermomicrobiales bacterium]HQZ90129.1 DUF4203 domain-containing protein [Thermomicrobiales bacterium]HRA31515.1 DUF4203 domain-containing protein [Thermomicrobiales bacterium]